MGHGHVKPNSDGSIARCGGPAICSVCQKEKAQLSERKPLFTAEDFLRFDFAGTRHQWCQAFADVANDKAAPLVEELERLRGGGDEPAHCMKAHDEKPFITTGFVNSCLRCEWLKTSDDLTYRAQNEKLRARVAELEGLTRNVGAWREKDLLEQKIAALETSRGALRASNARLRGVLEFIVTGPERCDHTDEAHRSNRYRLAAAVAKARAALKGDA